MKLYIKTLKIKIHNPPDTNSHFVFIFWHSKMLLGWWLFRNTKSAALVSQSKDGEILNNILTSWNYMVIRGSSSKGGKEALTELAELVKRGYSAVITPDGPRGPVNEIKNGALMISNITGVHIIPVSIAYHKKKILNRSWDRFEIPLPFSKCDIHFKSKCSYEEYLEGENLVAFKKNLSGQMS